MAVRDEYLAGNGVEVFRGAAPLHTIQKLTWHPFQIDILEYTYHFSSVCYKSVATLAVDGQHDLPSFLWNGWLTRCEFSVCDQEQ